MFTTMMLNTKGKTEKAMEKEVDKEMENILRTFPYQTHFGRILNVSGTSL